MQSIILTQTNFNKLKEEIKKNKDKKRIFTSEDDELNRKVLEKLEINILLLNQKNRKDFAKQRNSGLNQVLAKIAKKNKIQIGINIDELIFSQGKTKAQILARIQQNIKLCNKNKIQMQFISKSKQTPNSLKALGSTLGMPTWMTSKLVNEDV
ncbi:MAG: hypothetical protein KJ949_02705 [Nanoarchaeota archaeon]|nr:hypothetical protein [Nanoarchaeota archaeon]